MDKPEPCAVVVTSISRPNAVLRQLARDCVERNHHFIVAGDAKSPADFHLAGCDYLDLERQRGSRFAYARHAPTGHYARKNVGYLHAIAAGARVIIETDDDNIPAPAFYQPLPERLKAPTVENAGWCNVYSYFGDGDVWPRGLPLDAVQTAPPTLPEKPGEICAPIQQGLADDNPDVDAVYRLTRPLPVRFDAQERRVAIGKGTWCPFNSQNTAHYERAFPLLYLPAFCSFRMTDIWRSLVAQRIAWEARWHILFREPTVRQERNEHDLMRDFADEVPGYLHNRAIAQTLEALRLEPGEDALGENLKRCWRALAGAGFVGEGELTLLEAWLADLARLRLT